MHDLRRQALESGKTVSRKAQSRISSRASSTVNSRTNSRNASRQASDDEEGSISDSTTSTADLVDELFIAELPEGAVEAWKEDLANRIEEIIDRKRSSMQGRETALNAYAHYLMIHYADEEIQHKTSELFPALLKSVRANSSERETCLALRAIALTLITIPSESAYDGVFQALKNAYTDSELGSVKATAFHTLSTAAIFGGASDSEIEEIMDDFLEIIESDGQSVGAADSGEVVAAACQAWGFLATSIDDLQEKTEAAMDAFVEQLESSDVNVQIAAGECIALLFEKSYTSREDDEGQASDDEGADIESHYVKRYEAYRQKNQLQHTLSQLASESSKQIAKKDRKILHNNFTDILNTIEHPTLGPRYSMAEDKNGNIYGSRLTVKIHQTFSMKIDKWWKLHILQALRRVLGGGFINHYEKNPVVFEILPIMILDNNRKEAKGERKRGGEKRGRGLGKRELLF